MQTQLGLRPLPRSGTYRIFFVRNDGTIGEEVRHLPKGRKVFVHLQTGQPVLLGECGNPLTEQLPGYAPQRTERMPVQVDLRPELSVSEEPREEAPVEPPVVTAVFPVLPETGMLPETMENLTLTLWQGEPILSTEGLEVATVTESRDTDFVLVPLLLVALIGVIESTHSSPPPFVIPEPASMASLAAGMAMLVAWERRRRLQRGR
ncbi:MAG: hypothetical protein NZ741_00635 [Armatimonadetes bacterium]|nr:hypothetical protein [Armatimonadota bacterium]